MLRYNRCLDTDPESHRLRIRIRFVNENYPCRKYSNITPFWWRWQKPRTLTMELQHPQPQHRNYLSYNTYCTLTHLVIQLHTRDYIIWPCGPWCQLGAVSCQAMAWFRLCKRGGGGVSCLVDTHWWIKQQSDREYRDKTRKWGAVICKD